MTKPVPHQKDPYDEIADAWAKAHGNDPHAAIVALLGERDYLLGRIEALEASLSWGFVRAGAARR